MTEHKICYLHIFKYGMLQIFNVKVQFIKKKRAVIMKSLDEIWDFIF